jgi:hypothetical protein
MAIVKENALNDSADAKALLEEVPVRSSTALNGHALALHLSRCDADLPADGSSGLCRLCELPPELHRNHYAPNVTVTELPGEMRHLDKDAKMLSVVFLDEVALADKSPYRPLKALHPLLDRPATSMVRGAVAR